MSEKKTSKRGGFRWSERIANAAKQSIPQMALVPVELTANELDAVAALRGGSRGDVDALANGALAEIALEDGRLTEWGRRRAESAVKFLAALLDGKKHKAAMEDAKLTWAQVNSFIAVSPQFEQMYQMAKAGMKRRMGADVLDTAYDLATVGEEQFDKDGNSLGFKKKSEKMLDRLLVMSGAEFRKDGCADGGGAGGGGKPSVSLVFNYGGGDRQSMGVVDVKQE